MARFQELCLDTANPGSDIATFWSTVSGGEVDPADDGGPAGVRGRTEQQSMLICAVPEPKTVKNRVHLDVYARAIDDLTALGAVVDIPAEESGFGWTVMLDPEGNEFCAFLRPDNDQELPEYRVHGIGVDSADAESQAAWWGEAFDAQVDDNAEHGGGWWTLLHATGDPVLTIDFAAVPEPKMVKNRMHWHVRGSVAEFLDRGATRRWEMPRWTVLADPEGNEFCVFPEK